MDFSILLDNVRPIGQNFLPEGKCILSFLKKHLLPSFISK